MGSVLTAQVVRLGDVSPLDFSGLLGRHTGLTLWGVWISPLLAPPGLHAEADARDFMLSAAERPNKETPLFPSEWMCLDWGDADIGGEKAEKKTKINTWENSDSSARSHGCD